MNLGPRVLRICVEVAAPHGTGPTPSGEIRVVPFVGGSFHGDDLNGRLLPGGSDWQRLRSDHVLEIRAHYLLQTDREEVVEVISEGLRSASADVLARLDAGEAVDPGEYYFRTVIRFATASARLAHLQRHLYFSVGKRMPRGVELDVYRLP